VHGEINVKYCPTEDMLADLFTKALGSPKHEELCKKLEMLELDIGE
jgi:hypothetical protein